MFKLTKQFYFLTAYLVLVSLASSVAVAQPPSMPMMSVMPRIPSIELTEKSAKNSIDTYFTLREKYGDTVPPANNSQALIQGMRASADVNAIMAGNGFKNAGEWQKTITSVVLAHGFLKKGNRNDMDTQIAEIQANPEIPPAVKQQMLSSMKSMRPSDNNMNVVKRLLADPTYGAKIAEIMK